MADPVVPELTPAPSQAFAGPAERPRTCKACGAYHGSVGVSLACLERHLRIERDTTARLRAMLKGSK
jgi:hypothetical protein